VAVALNLGSNSFDCPFIGWSCFAKKQFNPRLSLGEKFALGPKNILLKSTSAETPDASSINAASTCLSNGIVGSSGRKKIRSKATISDLMWIVYS
jgi:hypothetical protein